MPIISPKADYAISSKELRFFAKSKFLFGMLLLIGITSAVDWMAEHSAAQENSSFRVIDNALSPQGLSQLLGSSSAVQKNVFSDEVTKMLADKLQKLDPESLSKLGEIAKKFSPNGSKNELRQTAKQFQELLKNDPEFRSSMESIAENMRDKGVDLKNLDPNALRGNSSFNPEDFPKEIDSELREQIENRIKQFSRSNIPTNDLDSLRSGLSGTPLQSIPNRNGSSPFSPNMSPFSTDPTNQRDGNRSSQNAPSRNPSNNRLDRNGSPDPNGSPDRNGSQRPTPQGQRNSNNQNSGRPNRSGLDGFGQQSNSSNGNSSRPNNSDINQGSDPRDNSSSGFGRNDGTQGQGFSNQSQSSAGASENALPKETAGRKFNRILMKSLSNAVEKKLGNEAGSGVAASADGSKSSFDRLLSKLVDKIQNNADPEVASSNSSNANSSSSGNQSSTGNNRSSGRTTRSSLNSWFRSTSSASSPMELPDVSVQSVIYFMLFAAAIVAFIVFMIRQTKLGSILGFESPERKIQTPPHYAQSFSQQGEIVSSIDRLALWLFGTKAEWWNSKIVNHEFANNRPELTDEIDKVMTVYDTARYAPDDEVVSPKVATEVRSTLVKLADPRYVEQPENE